MILRHNISLKYLQINNMGVLCSVPTYIDLLYLWQHCFFSFFLFFTSILLPDSIFTWAALGLFWMGNLLHPKPETFEDQHGLNLQKWVSASKLLFLLSSSSIPPPPLFPLSYIPPTLSSRNPLKSKRNWFGHRHDCMGSLLFFLFFFSSFPPSLFLWGSPVRLV